jgi:hypothetical protein
LRPYGQHKDKTMSVRYIALCGAPGAGKSEVQRLLDTYYHFRPIDDSRILREAAMILYGLEDWHVSTQEGKSVLITVGDEQISVRRLLGELGLHLEKRDPHHIPKRALADAIAEFPTDRLSFGSVRRDQAKVFKDTGEGLIVEVRRPGFEPKNDFDHYDRDLVDIVVHNAYNPDDPAGSTARLLDEIERKIAPIVV